MINIIEGNDEIEVEYPEVLYKYRDWNNPLHKKILTENSLYLASPKDFEDINDCNVPEINPTKKELYNYILVQLKIDMPNRTRFFYRKSARDKSKKSPFTNSIELKELKDKLRKEFNEKYGVLSLTPNSQNDDMWKKYSNNHKGICIGFEAKSLFNYVGGGGKVQYVDKLPNIYLLKDKTKTIHEKKIFNKEKKWEYEQEYRLHKIWRKTATDNERNIKLPQNCIVEIILGKMMENQEKSEIMKIATEKYPNARIIEY